MKYFNSWELWVIIYIISAVLFAHTFKKANRDMENAGSLTILLEISTAFFSLLLIPFFKWSLPTSPKIYLTLLIVTIIYAATDRLNIESRYGLDPSTFSMLKQLSTVFMIIFGFIFFKETLIIHKIIGAIIIILANLILTFEKGKIKINKYFIMSFISNFLFAIAMLINVNISDNFNLAFYTILTVSIPACIIFIFEHHNIKELSNEFKLYDKKSFLLSGLTWCLMLISSVKAYQLGSVTIVAPLFALTSIINAIVEFIFNKNKNKLIQKLIAAILLILGVILVKM
mgnify:CR=1 FL=1